MEDYSTLERLGKGAQGSVHLVKHKVDGQFYVLKKVECNDEGEANKAIKEANALQELQHPYICGYKEFFVIWDKEERAMNVCIVMDHYKNGDLAKLLKIQRDKKKEPINELVIKKWLGQIVEALAFVHNKKIIHRDLKPSNLFLHDDLSISLGDFGVATIMGDIRTKTRTAVGTMNWMAPEVMERPYDERSDVWSLGCIVAEMITCGVYESGEMSQKLVELRMDPACLDTILNAVDKYYSADLISTVRTMLRKNFEQRPTAEQLIDLPYIKECLDLTGSAIVSRRHKQSVTTGDKPIPQDKGVEDLIDYIKMEICNENCVKEALELLVTSGKHKELTDGHLLDLCQAMRENVACSEICTTCLNLVSDYIVKAKKGGCLHTMDVIAPVILTMKSHSKSATIQQLAAALLMAISCTKEGAMLIGKEGGIQCILEAISSFKGNPELFSVACNALWSICIREENARIATKEKALMIICEGMRLHATVPEAQETGSACLLSLSLEDDNIDQAAEMEVIYLLLMALKAHSGHTKLVKNVCSALASFIEADEESALLFLDCENKGNVELAGIPILMQIYDIHKDNVEVVTAIASLIKELMEHDDIAPAAKSDLFLKKLNDMRKKYLKNEIISSSCKTALAKLDTKK